MTSLQLRPYQRDCLDRIKEFSSLGCSNQLVHLPTGSGKTIIFSHLIQETQERALVLAHTNEILEQAKEKIEMVCPGIKAGIVNGEAKQFDTPVVISSIQSARQPETLRRLKEQNFSLLIADECHHFGAETPKMIVEALGFSPSTANRNNNLLVGFSATPFRNDGLGLEDVFQRVVFEKSIKDMIRDGYLCFPKGVKVATSLDFSKVQIEGDDYSALSLSKVMDTDEVNELIIKTYTEKALGRQTICFGVTIAHAEDLAKRFVEAGIPSLAIHGKMSRHERSDILAQYKAGTINVLCNCQVLTEGFDAPQTDCVVVARPTQSAALYQQMVGRGLRLFPNKSDCLVIDFSDKNHTLCNTAILTGNAECVFHDESKQCTKYDPLKQHLPLKLNQKLKKAILDFDPLGESFSWQRELCGSYLLKGSGLKQIKIEKDQEERYSVFLLNGSSRTPIAINISFEYAFGAAEDYAKANRNLFVISDLDASWRDLPISEKQRSFFSSHGYKTGIESLSRGQASLIIGSGIINTKSRQALTKTAFKTI